MGNPPNEEGLEGHGTLSYRRLYEVNSERMIGATWRREKNKEKGEGGREEEGEEEDEELEVRELQK